jgi:hypothetical protein
VAVTDPAGAAVGPCAHARCTRETFKATIIKQRGAPVEVVLDAQPRTWEEGARYRVLPKLILTGATRVEKLTTATAHRGFGATGLYVEHREVCMAEQRRTKAKKADGSHA